MFDDIFDKTFKKYVQTDTFRLPMSVKELRLFSYKICQSFADEYYNNSTNNSNSYNSLTLRDQLIGLSQCSVSINFTKQSLEILVVSYLLTNEFDKSIWVDLSVPIPLRKANITPHHTAQEITRLRTSSHLARMLQSV